MKPDDADPSTTPVGGTAVELPTDYIRRGMAEGLDDTLALENILAHRTPAAPGNGPAAPTPGTPTTTPGTPAPTPGTPAPTPGTSAPAPAARTPAPAPAARTPATAPPPASDTPGNPAPGSPAPGSHTPASTPSVPRQAPTRRARTTSRSTPVIKPSVVHIPAPLLPLMAAERQRSGRSNGQILIAAIEDGHEYLVKQHNESSSIGGRLFTARTAKPQLPVAEPLSPLNIRLYEQDYEVLDRLVAELGAVSRSRLATLALAHYLDSSA